MMELARRSVFGRALDCVMEFLKEIGIDGIDDILLA